MPRNDPQAVAVEIYDQTYRLRGHNRAYVEKLAAIVDSKMRSVAAHGRTVDSLRVAVLAALNLADELARLTERYEAVTAPQTAGDNTAALRNRAHSLSVLLDEILDEDEPGDEGEHHGEDEQRAD